MFVVVSGIIITVASAIILWLLAKLHKRLTIRKSITVEVYNDGPRFMGNLRTREKQTIPQDSITATISIAKQETVILTDFYIESEHWPEPWHRTMSPFQQSTLTHDKPVKVSRGRQPMRDRFANAGVNLPRKCRAVFVSQYG